MTLKNFAGVFVGDAISPKSSRKPTAEHPSLEVFLSKLEKQIFKILDSKLDYSNFSKEGWQTV